MHAFKLRRLRADVGGVLRTVTLVALALGLAAGCASRGTQDYSHLLDEMKAREAELAGAETEVDVPESPDEGLSPLPASLAQAGEITIQRDCLLQIRVEEDGSLNGTYPVNDIGAVELGYVGPIILFNKTEKEAEGKIAKTLEARDFHTATVSVRILRASYDRVRVTGGVVKPGMIQIGAGDSISLNDALLRVNGIKASAPGMRVKVVRGGMLNALASALPGEVYELIGEDGSPAVPDVTLRNNDVAFVYAPSAKAGGSGANKAVLVLGEVHREGFYAFGSSEPCTLMHLLFKMEKLPPYANLRSVRVIRRNADGVDEEKEINAKRILKEGNPDFDVALQHGDRVIVPARRINLF